MLTIWNNKNQTLVDNQPLKGAEKYYRNAFSNEEALQNIKEAIIEKIKAWKALEGRTSLGELPDNFKI